MKRLSHTDAEGAARMVDISAKAVTERQATASAKVAMGTETLRLVRGGKVAKGDVLATARLAGITAAKRTADLIPLCHPLPLDEVAVELEFEVGGIAIAARVKATARTGVEMEALTAACVAALTVYDMCKALDRGIAIGPVRLERKSGGAGGTFERGTS